MKLFKKKPKETASSRLRRGYDEWFAHATGLDNYYTVQEMIAEGILSLPEYEKEQPNDPA